MPMMKTVCKVEGCKGQTRGKEYCGKHMRGKKVPVVITAAARLNMRSSCHNAACEHGEKHEYGQQYCSKCKQACQWKTVAA